MLWKEETVEAGEKPLEKGQEPTKKINPHMELTTAIEPSPRLGEVMSSHHWAILAPQTILPHHGRPLQLCTQLKQSQKESLKIFKAEQGSNP